eukprot:GHVU01146596.1.p1 GENE.GHVU01146596.1~~GHVU01146596.1.p1  ORF type:complete len:148 (-),score=8.12 GHVU01146596.1:53-496(-)
MQCCGMRCGVNVTSRHRSDVTVRLHFWLEEKQKLATVEVNEPENGEALDEKAVMAAFAKQQSDLYAQVKNWRVFLTTEGRYERHMLVWMRTESEHIFKKTETDLRAYKSRNDTYHLLLLEGNVSRSWKPEARAGRSRTGTCLCPNLP